MKYFCNTKDGTPIINQSFVVYELTYPGCGANYVEKTERTLYERCVEHAWSDQNSVDQIISTSVLKCSTFLIIPVFVCVQHFFQMVALLGILTI